MPPNQPKLPDAVIADLIAWVKMGAPDPREGKAGTRPASVDWETVYGERLKWWSLQPLVKAQLPESR